MKELLILTTGAFPVLNTYQWPFVQCSTVEHWSTLYDTKMMPILNKIIRDDVKNPQNYSWSKFIWKMLMLPSSKNSMRPNNRNMRIVYIIFPVWHLVLSHFGTAMCSNVETNRYLSWTCLVCGLLSFEHPSVLLFCSYRLYPSLEDIFYYIQITWCHRPNMLFNQHHRHQNGFQGGESYDTEIRHRLRQRHWMWVVLHEQELYRGARALWVS